MPPILKDHKYIIKSNESSGSYFLQGKMVKFKFLNELEKSQSGSEWLSTLVLHQNSVQIGVCVLVGGGAGRKIEK